MQVVATSGVDVGLYPMALQRKSILRNPIDIELFYSENSDSLLNLNRAKEEIVVEVSPVHMILSEDRYVKYP